MTGDRQALPAGETFPLRHGCTALIYLQATPRCRRCGMQVPHPDPRDGTCMSCTHRDGEHPEHPPSTTEETTR